MSDTQGRNADILQSIIEGTTYTDPPRSRNEDLLLQLKGLVGGYAEDIGALDTRVTALEGKDLFTVQIYDAQDAGETVTISDGEHTYTATIGTDGRVDIPVKFPGVYTATVNGVRIGSANVGVYSIDNETVVFAFHYSENDSDPDSVTYPAGYSNSNFTDPAYMDFTNDTFHYGDWDPNGANADLLKWFYPKSCMLKYDGTVAYYLDENDETKKADGTDSDVTNAEFGGNAMMEWGQDGKQIYWKIIPDADGNGFTFVVANGDNNDPDMKPWNHYNCRGNVAKHFYTPKYFGSSDGTRLRSLSGAANSVNLTAEQEITLATANNQTSDEIWYTEVYADWLLTTMLGVLMTKSTNSQATLGYGRCGDYNTAAVAPGTLNGKGMFYGKTDRTTGVKVFGMENAYGNLWRRIAGMISDRGAVKIKLTHGTEDGSTTEGYNLTGEGYISHGSTSGTNGGYISRMNASNRGLSPSVLSGSDSTYYTDGAWLDNTQVCYAFVGGGYWGYGLLVGAFCCFLAYTAPRAAANIGAAISCKPLPTA